MIDFKSLRDDLIQKTFGQNAFYLSKMAIFVKIAPNGECSTGRNAFYLRKMAIFVKIAPLFSHVRVQNRQMIDFKGLPDGRTQSQHRAPPPRAHFDFAKLPRTWSPGPDRDRASISLPAEKSPSPCTHKKRVLKPQDKNLLGKKL